MPPSTVPTAVTSSRRGHSAGTTYRRCLESRHSPSYIGAGGEGFADGAKCSCPVDLRRKALKSHSKVKEKFGGECNCEGDERHPGGCKSVRIGL